MHHTPMSVSPSILYDGERACDGDEKDRALVRSIVALSKDLGIRKIVAKAGRQAA